MKNRHPVRIAEWLLMALAGFLAVMNLGGCEYVMPNKPPYVEKLAPSDTARFRVGTVVRVAVKAYDVDGRIDSVLFSLPGPKTFADYEEPYEYKWVTSTAYEGVNFVTVTAYDNSKDIYTIRIPIRLIRKDED